MSRRLLLWGPIALFSGAAVAACGHEPEPVSGPNVVDVGFCTDMALHHEQAVAMCQRVLGADTGGPVQAAAAEILQNQSYERGLMYAWLAAWDQSTAPPSEVMGWMGEAMPAAEMPGLASPTQMRALAASQGRSKGGEFLRLMRAHHVGGVHMTEAAVNGAATGQVRGLARQMSIVQNYEIDLFDHLLSTTYR